MKRTIAVVASLIAAVALSCTSADAHWRHRKVDHRVKAVEVGAAVASTVTYFSLLDWNWSKHSAGYKWGAAGAVTLGCLVVSPIIAAALVPERQLTNREVGVLAGSCVIPIIGGWLVNAAYDAHPEWEPERMAMHKRHHRHHHKMMMKKMK